MKKNSKKVHRTKSPGQLKIEYRGKPSQLKHTKLEAPKIWTNSDKCIKLVKYLTLNGRHNFLHQAGKHSDKFYNDQQKNIQNTKIYYEYAQDIAGQLFDTKWCTKRCFVFFFRSTNEAVSVQDFMQYDLLYENIQILSLVQNLLSQSFMSDLIQILCTNNEINSIIEMLFLNKESPSQYSHIIQNLFIRYQIQLMIQEQRNKPQIDIVRQEFEIFLQEYRTKYLVREFIDDILQIFKKSTSLQEQQFDMIPEVNYLNGTYQ